MMTSKYFRTFAFWTVSVLIWGCDSQSSDVEPECTTGTAQACMCTNSDIQGSQSCVAGEWGPCGDCQPSILGGRPAPVVPDAGGGEANGSCVVCTDAPPFYQTCAGDVSMADGPGQCLADGQTCQTIEACCTRVNRTVQNSGCGACISVMTASNAVPMRRHPAVRLDMPIAGTPMMDLPVMGGEPSGGRCEPGSKYGGPGSV